MNFLFEGGNNVIFEVNLPFTGRKLLVKPPSHSFILAPGSTIYNFSQH